MSAVQQGRTILAPRWGLTLGTFSQDRLPSAFLVLTLAPLVSFALVALLAPTLAPYSPVSYVTPHMEPPSAAHLLGTNDVGQDLLSILIHGTRVSMLVALLGGSVGLALALLVGSLAGFLRGAVDGVLMRLVDLLMAVPHLPLMIVLAAFLGPGLVNLMLVIVALAWVRPARVVRSQLLSLRSRGYISSARLCGARWPYLMRRHLLPALAPVAAAAFVSQASRAVILEASLAFLGLGDPTLQSWGTMMRYALNFRGLYLTSAWVWWLLPPGVCLTLLIAGLSMLGTMVESRANTRLSRHWGRG